jgi:hypothetical protein
MHTGGEGGRVGGITKAPPGTFSEKIVNKNSIKPIVVDPQAILS